MRHGRQFGFTLIELVVTLTVAVVLVMLAAPSFRDLVDKSRLRGATDDVVNLLNTARASAVKLERNVSVTIDSGTWCAGAKSASDPGTVGDPVSSTSVAACDCTLPATDTSTSVCYIGGTTNGAYSVVSTASYSGVTVKSGSVDSTILSTNSLTFNSKFGTLDLNNLPAGSLVTLVSPSGKYSTQVTLSPLGQVNACSVGGKFISGYPSC